MSTTAATVRITPLEQLTQAAECLRVLAHPHRLRMIQLLLQQELTVGQLAQACQIPHHMASEHLRLMQRCGFLTSRRQGRCTYYQVVEPHLKNILQCIESRFGVQRQRLADLAWAHNSSTKRRKASHRAGEAKR